MFLAQVLSTLFRGVMPFQDADLSSHAVIVKEVVGVLAVEYWDCFHNIDAFSKFVCAVLKVLHALPSEDNNKNKMHCTKRFLVNMFETRARGSASDDVFTVAKHLECLWFYLFNESFWLDHPLWQELTHAHKSKENTPSFKIEFFKVNVSLDSEKQFWQPIFIDGCSADYKIAHLDAFLREYLRLSKDEDDLMLFYQNEILDAETTVKSIVIEGKSTMFCYV